VSGVWDGRAKIRTGARKLYLSKLPTLECHRGQVTGAKVRAKQEIANADTADCSRNCQRSSRPGMTVQKSGGKGRCPLLVVVC